MKIFLLITFFCYYYLLFLALGLKVLISTGDCKYFDGNKLGFGFMYPERILLVPNKETATKLKESNTLSLCNTFELDSNQISLRADYQFIQEFNRLTPIKLVDEFIENSISFCKVKNLWLRKMEAMMTYWIEMKDLKVGTDVC